MLGFGAAVLRLTYLTTVQSSELQESAVDLQLADTTVSAKRGTIYDANGNVLAESASVWQVVMSPVNFKNDKQRQAAAKGLSGLFTALPRYSISFCIRYPTADSFTNLVTPTVEQCAR